MTNKNQKDLELALLPIRVKIDALDDQLIEWLEKRISLIKEVGHIKNKYGAPALSKTREEEILLRIKDKAVTKGIPISLTEDIWRCIFKAAYKLEEKND